MIRENSEIQKNGKLVATYYKWDKTTHQGSEVVEDITAHAARNIFQPCTLQEGLTLRDILMLLDSDLIVFDAILGNWCADIVEEGLRKPPAKTKAHDDLDYLELYWHVTEFKGELDGLQFPGFHAVSKPVNPDGSVKNIRTNYAIELVAVNKLVDLPIKLNPRVEVWRSDSEPEDFKTPSFTSSLGFTVGQILHGIIHELSFFGSPSNRDATADDFQQRIDDAFNHPETLISGDEVIRKLRETISSRMKPPEGESND